MHTQYSKYTQENYNNTQSCLIIKDKADRMSRNVGKKTTNLRLLTSQKNEDLSIDIKMMIKQVNESSGVVGYNTK